MTDYSSLVVKYQKKPFWQCSVKCLRDITQNFHIHEIKEGWGEGNVHSQEKPWWIKKCM